MSEPSAHEGTSSHAAAPPPQQCQAFPDVCPQDPKGVPPDDRARAEEEHIRKHVMYRAIRYILVHDFGFTNHLPETVDRFPGNLDRAGIAQYLAIHGILLAENYTDPTLGKDRPAIDDVVIPYHGRSIFIARRFVDAVVKAVQEYTAQAKLFQKVYVLMAEEGAQQAGPAAARKPSPMAQV